MPANPNSYAIMSIDPGKTTGLAVALIDRQQPTVAAAIRRSHRKGLLRVSEVTGDYWDQSWQLASGFFEMIFKWHVERALVPAGQCLLVTEGFTVQTLAADLTPVQINAALGVLIRAAYGQRDPAAGANEYEATCSEQPPSDKSFCSDVMLKDWRLWFSSPHKRDAVRHLARRIDRLLSYD